MAKLTTKSKKTGTKVKKSTAKKIAKKRTSRVANVAKLQSYRLNPLTALIAASLVAILGFVLWRVFAATSDQPAPAGSTATCGANVAPYTYKVPFGDSPWNIPACNLPVLANDQATAVNYGKRLYNYAQAWNASSPYWQGDAKDGNVFTYMGKTGIAAQKGKVMTQFGLAGDANDFSTPIYYANASTAKRQIKICNDANCNPSNLDKNQCFDVTDLTCMVPDLAIPFDSSWRPSGDADGDPFNNAGDREMIIIDTATGYSYELWQVDIYGGSCLAGRTFLYALAGKNPDSRLCVGGAITIRDKDGKQASIYGYNQGLTDSRGMGIENTAMIVTPEEVAAGEIRHALTMEIFNVMYGPDCGAQISNKIDPSIVNKACGTAVAPAGKFEWRAATDASRLGQCDVQVNQLADFNTKQTFRQLLTPDKTIPEGMRFKINNTDAEIDAWIAGRADLKADPVKAKTARIFAVALRDYGVIPGDQTCYGAGITIAGAANPDAKTRWAQLGIKDASSQNLLDGLFRENNIIALDPPVSTCVDGTTTQFYCKWTKSIYPNVTLPPTTTTTVTNAPLPNVPPIVTITSISSSTILPADTSTPMAVTATDSDGIAKVEFYNGTTKLGEDITEPYSIDLFKLAGPTATLKAVATDKKGLQGASAAITVKVASSGAPAPTTSTVTPPPCNPADKTVTCTSGGAQASIIPTNPANLSAALNINMSIWRYDLTLKWDASTGGGGIKEYIIARNGVDVGKSTTPSFVDTTVESNTLYLYAVTAVGLNGNRSLPAVYAATPKCTWIFCSL
ncbi:MAG: Ig-like domain-containing protein [Candidatus Saccharibacteria bacterium]